MTHRIPPVLILALLWSALMAAAFATRPLLPVDETRYLAVAWEMWRRGDFLVPYLNGETYSHKPPLLFWLFHFGWSITGVNEWWPRLVPPLVSLVNLFLTAKLAQALWPEIKSVRWAAPWILFGSLLWVTLFTVVQFDQCLVLFTLLGLWGVVRGLQGHGSGWWINGLALGLGILCKGPVIWLHVLPAALLAPWWVADQSPVSWRRYYASLLVSVLLGAGIALSWAIPAGSAGGEVYRNAIFWQQTAARTVNAAVHQQPFWWYLVLLPMALLPWTLWPPLWKALGRFGQLSRDAGMRFCIAWFVPGLLIFSLVSSKQLKYLLPLVPALALLAARVLHDYQGKVRLLVPGLLLSSAGLFMLLAGAWASEWGLPQWGQQISWGWGALLLLAGVITGVLPAMEMTKALMGSAAASILLAVVFHLGVIRGAAPAYDLSMISARLAALQHDHVPVANVAKYHGQYHFLGRLTEPLEFFLWDDAPAWARRHPGGYLLLYYKQQPRRLPEAEYLQAYRGGSLVLWRSQTLLEHPEWLRTLPTY